MIKICIYEDNRNLREGLTEMFELSDRFNVIASYENCNDIETETEALKPDVLLMDIDMPGTNGIMGISLAKKALPGIRILMFTVFDDEEKIFAAIKSGADGYLLKKTVPEKIMDALEDVYAGGAPMTPAIARKVLNQFTIDNPFQNKEKLTEKEKDVLGFLVKGLSHKMIGAEMQISIDTVRTHLKKIYVKLHVNSMTQAVSKAIKDRLV